MSTSPAESSSPLLRSSCDRCRGRKLRCSGAESQMNTAADGVDGQKTGQEAQTGGSSCTRCRLKGLPCTFSESLPLTSPRRYHQHYWTTGRVSDAQVSSVPWVVHELQDHLSPLIIPVSSDAVSRRLRPNIPHLHLEPSAMSMILRAASSLRPLLSYRMHRHSLTLPCLIRHGTIRPPVTSVARLSGRHTRPSISPRSTRSVMMWGLAMDLGVSPREMMAQGG